ncbi:MAG UNVERIFIED_CONTAM: hypothetical protein LVR29_30450 [Microcystis novacekii LVE1205-3]
MKEGRNDACQQWQFSQILEMIDYLSFDEQDDLIRLLNIGKKSKKDENKLLKIFLKLERT